MTRRLDALRLGVPTDIIDLLDLVDEQSLDLLRLDRSRLVDSRLPASVADIGDDDPGAESLKSIINLF